MNRPKIHDKEGHALEIGSQVERAFDSGKTGGMVGEILGLTKLDILVEWPSIHDRPHGHRRFYKSMPHPLLQRDYRCPDLLLARTNPDEDQQGIPH